ncbi:hypothetical protein QTP70_032666 [Hemibagrus guttatus]|uniref:Uncharacterized protein n=1 Tax=Hemibagrus guttatus TaxID=175788 RepID=A0AAE0RIA5_9TELE|nr:hypothetical protein QTP70_032666 [Hemibagrus guttatus]
MGSLCLSQASSGIKAGYTLDGVPTHLRVHSFTHTITHYVQFRDANQPTMHVFGNRSTWRKPPRHGENMQTPHTHGGGRNRTPNHGGEANVLITKPPCPPSFKASGHHSLALIRVTQILMPANFSCFQHINFKN